MQQQNISPPDRYMRFVAGMLAFGCASTRRRRHSPLTRAFLYSFGAMKLAEGVTGWCPLQAVSKKSGNAQGNSQTTQANNEQTKTTPPLENGAYPPSYAQYQSDSDQ